MNDVALNASPEAADLDWEGEAEAIEAVPLRHYGRWIAAILSLLAFAWVIRVFALTPNINWAAVREYLTYPEILRGLKLTIAYTLISMAAGLGIGIIIASMRLSTNAVLRTLSWFYVWLFRGTPLLVQIIFWFNAAMIVPRLGIRIPFTNWGVSTSTNVILTTSVAAVLALGLNEAAYMSEILRAGIQMIDYGQTDAGLALGMKKRLIFRIIVLPQAMRAIIPPTGNEFIGLLKSTSLVSVIAGQELLTKAQLIYSVNMLTVELLLVAAFWYMVVTTVLTWIQYYIERHYARGSTNRELPPTPLQHLRASARRMFASGGSGGESSPLATGGPS